MSAISEQAKNRPKVAQASPIMNTDLRLTDTNAASDSQGRTWGLEGNLFWYLVGGLGAGITMFFVLIVIMKAGLLSSFGVAVLPVLLVLAYIYGLRQGKSPGYDRDFLERMLSGGGFGPQSGGAGSQHSKHPLTPYEDPIPGEPASR